jgi:hypothetical protein
MSIIISPIAKNYNKTHNSKRDYEEFENRLNNNLQPCWDSVPKHLERSSDNPKYFGFIFNGDKAIFHKIHDIKDPKHRLESWQDNVGQTNRKVLLLSDERVILDWKVWLLYCDGVTCQGTTLFRKGEQKLINFINKFKLL